MRVFAFLNGLFDGIRPEIFIAAGIVLLAVDCLIAFRAERETVFAALALFTGGLCFLPALISSRFSVCAELRSYNSKRDCLHGAPGAFPARLL